MSSSLAQRLKHGTADLHTRAERAGLMVPLLAGAVERAPYCALLRALHAIYETLERALRRHAAHPAVAPVCFPALFRTDALARDLDALHGPHWRAQLHTGAATRRYVDRLDTVDETAPQLLVAHAYVRYLGDLNGGRILHRRVATALNLNGAGTAFYAYDAPGSEITMAAAFRRGLDAIAPDEALAGGIVAEAQAAFGGHIEIFEELAAPPAQPANDRM